VTGGWGRLHNEEFHKFYASPNIIRVIKLRALTCVWQISHVDDRKTLREEDLYVGWRIIL
jgi:hypothetical protein